MTARSQSVWIPRSRWLSLAVALAVSSQSLPALGQRGSETSAAAEDLFTRGKQLLDKKQYRDACLKLEESQRLDPAIGTLLYLGFCYERIGKDASAWSTYRAAQSAANQAGQARRAQIAQRRAERVEPRLARLVINLSSTAPDGLRIARNGVELGTASLGQAVPVDPGEHVIVARAPGRQAFSKVVTAEPGHTTIVDVGDLLSKDADHPALAADTSTVDTRAPAPAPLTQSQLLLGDEPLKVRDQSRSSSAQRWIGIGTGVVGVAGIAVGTTFALRSKSKSNAAEEYRRPGTNIYDEPGFSLNSEALDARKVAIASSAVGAAALVGGAIIYLTAGSSRPKTGGLVTNTAVLVLPNAITFEGQWH